MKFLWYIISLVLIILVLINNPKSGGVSSLNRQNKLFTTNRKATSVIEVFTSLFIILFLLFTVVLSSYYEY
jgi:protein translocase SecG subunit